MKCAGEVGFRTTGLGGDVGVGVCLFVMKLVGGAEGLGGDNGMGVTRLVGEIGGVGEVMPAMYASLSLGMVIEMLFLRLFLFSLLLFLSSLLGIALLLLPSVVDSVSVAVACTMKLSVSYE